MPHAPGIRWRRLDVPGRETAHVQRPPEGGWQLTGEVVVEESGVLARLRYDVRCDDRWHTRAAVVEGTANGQPVHVALAADGAGRWRHEDGALPALAGALDLDLAFTPATNLLPIRRLALAVGETRPVRSAWLRFPELRLEPLAQRYTRAAERAYVYEALVDGAPFRARLDTDAFGRVLRYEGLWAVEPEEPTRRGR